MSVLNAHVDHVYGFVEWITGSEEIIVGHEVVACSLSGYLDWIQRSGIRSLKLLWFIIIHPF
jgi:hypothetical protein